MHSMYNQQTGQLLVHRFRGKFQTLTKLNDGDLALFFEKLFDHVPTDPASQRMIALQEGEVIGTISIKWKTEIASRKIFPDRKNFHRFGKWNLLKMFIGLSFLDHKPQAGECNITDVVVHPDHQDKGRIVSTRHPPFRKYRLYPLIYFT